MDFSTHALWKMIEQGEGLTLEFKECRSGLNRDVFETVCAFLNRNGGTLLLGVGDNGTVTGIESSAVVQIRKDFVTAVNNPQKINPPAYLSVDEIDVAGKRILRIFIPESSQVHRCNGRIYDRNEDGDLDITDHSRLVGNLYQRKQATYSENMIFPHAGLAELRADLIAKCRRLAGVHRKDHPWLDLGDLELLKSAQLYQTDPETGRSGMTLAGILLLGKDEVILSAVPHHRTDLILRKVNLDRYDDRDFVDTNLVESYERIMAFVAKHLPDPFFLEGDTRISIRDAIFREIASNILIHREYRNAYPAKLIIERGQVRTENSNKPHGFGPLDPASFTPFPKNPVIARFFRQIGRGDELGSGMRNLLKYCKAFGGRDPELIEGDLFRIVVRYPDHDTPMINVKPLRPGVEAQVEAQVGAQVGAQVELVILSACLQAPLGSTEITKVLGHKQLSGNIRKALPRLLAAGLLEYTIPDKPRSRFQKYQLTEKGRRYLNFT